LRTFREETSYYACQKEHTAEVAGIAIRNHWGIESHHHVRDVTFEEDASRIRQKPTIMARFRTFVINIFKANDVQNCKRELTRNAYSHERIFNYKLG
jgi:predicted transposase YbfD/YdcC